MNQPFSYLANNSDEMQEGKINQYAIIDVNHFIEGPLCLALPCAWSQFFDLRNAAFTNSQRK